MPAGSRSNAPPRQQEVAPGTARRRSWPGSRRAARVDALDHEGAPVPEPDPLESAPRTCPRGPRPPCVPRRRAGRRPLPPVHRGTVRRAPTMARSSRRRRLGGVRVCRAARLGGWRCAGRQTARRRPLGLPHGQAARSRRPPTRPGGAEAADPLREAGPAAVLLDARLPARPRAGAAPGRGADGLLRRLPPAPEDQLRQRRADRDGERGGVLRDLGDRAGRPRVGPARPSTRRCPTGWTCSRWSRRRPGALADRLQGSDWVMDFPGVTARSCSGRPTSCSRWSVVEVTRTFKTGPRTFDVRSAVVSMTTAPSAAARLCDTSGGRTAHHTGRTPRRRPDRAASSHGADATDTTPGDPTGARPAAPATAGVADPLAADEGGDGA